MLGEQRRALLRHFCQFIVYCIFALREKEYHFWWIFIFRNTVDPFKNLQNDVPPVKIQDIEKNRKLASIAIKA